MLATQPGSRSFARSNNQQPSDQGLTTTISKVLEVVSGIFLPKNFVQQKTALSSGFHVLCGLRCYNYCWSYVCKRAQLEGTIEGFHFATCVGDSAWKGSVKSIVFADTNILAGVHLSATLTEDNLARARYLSVVEFSSEAFGLRVAAQLCGAGGFFCCHSGKIAKIK